MNDNALFEVAIKAILRKDGKILLLTAANNGGYDFPGGKMKESERSLPLIDILDRETREELGENVQIEVGDLAFVAKRYLKRNGKEHHILAIYYSVNYKSGDIVLSDEHSEFAWIDPTSIFDHPEKFITEDEYQQYKKFFKEIK